MDSCHFCGKIFENPMKNHHIFCEKCGFEAFSARGAVPEINKLINNILFKGEST